MQYRSLGPSDLEVPVITFGAWAIGGWMWGGTDDQEAIQAIQRGIDCGITCIDTAPTYGMGHSEKIVGEAIKGRREGLVIATKCGVRWDLAEGDFRLDTHDNEGKPVQLWRCLKPHSIREECERSLQRLGIDVIDLYQIHWPESTTPLEESMDALLDLQRQGKIRHIGVSNFTPEMMAECLAVGPIVSDQPPYNALERGVEADVLPFCREHGLGVLAYSPIAQGLLTGAVTLDREFAEGDWRKDKPLFRLENRRKILDMLERVRPIAQAHEATFAQLFLAWLIAQPGVTTALAGARTPGQIEENAKAADLRLTPGEVATIRSEVESLDFDLD